MKSRFSHRYAHISLPRNLPAYWEICKQGLLVGTDELIQGGVGSGLNNLGEFQSFWESMIEVSLSRLFPWIPFDTPRLFTAKTWFSEIIYKCTFTEANQSHPF